MAEISYFLSPQHTRKGLGSAALRRLAEEAQPLGIRKLVANISSANPECIAFHRRRGFEEYGRLKDIGRKLGTTFSVVWIGKDLDGVGCPGSPSPWRGGERQSPGHGPPTTRRWPSM